MGHGFSCRQGKQPGSQCSHSDGRWWPEARQVRMRGQTGREWVRKETLLDMVTNRMWVRGRKARDDPKFVAWRLWWHDWFGEDPMYWGPAECEAKKGRWVSVWGKGWATCCHSSQAPTTPRL